MTTINLDINRKVFNPVYYPYLTDDTPNQIFYGGSSSGKSYFLAQRCVLDMIKGGHNYLVIRKVANTLEKSVYNEIRKAITFFKLDQYFTAKNSPLMITCFNGYQILFGGMDDPEKVKSITPSKGVLTDVWYEEATESDPEDIKQLDKRLRGQSKVRKRIILSFNPIYQTHYIYTDYFAENWADDKQAYKDDRLLILKTTYKDNKFLTADDVERLEAEKDEYWRQVYLLGNWGILGGAIFTNWKVEDLTSKRKTFDNFCNGLDFGFAEDPAAAVRCSYDRKHNKLYILDELYERGLTNDDLAKVIKPMFHSEIVLCDAAEPKSIAELQQRGINATAAEKGKDSVLFGIQWLQQLEIIIDIKCNNAKNEFSTYKWQENSHGDVVPKPVDRNNHLIDALRYALSLEMYYYKEQKAAEHKARDYTSYKEIDDEPSWMAY